MLVLVRPLGKAEREQYARYLDASARQRLAQQEADRVRRVRKASRPGAKPKEIADLGASNP